MGTSDINACHEQHYMFRPRRIFITVSSFQHIIKSCIFEMSRTDSTCPLQISEHPNENLSYHKRHMCTQTAVSNTLSPLTSAGHAGHRMRQNRVQRRRAIIVMLQHRACDGVLRYRVPDHIPHGVQAGEEAGALLAVEVIGDQGATGVLAARCPVCR